MNGDMVQKALAQLSGPTFVPVAFSFGWVVYSIQAFSSAIGTGRLMPPAPDVESIIVNVGSGHSRPNRSWILGRLLRDWDYESQSDQGLNITVLDAVSRAKLVEDIKKQTLLLGGTDDIELAGTSRPGDSTPAPWLERYYKMCPTKVLSIILNLQVWWKIRLLDKGNVWIFAWSTIVLQFLVAAVPLKLHHDASTMVITGFGTVFALGYGALPRWKEEKHHCRTNTPHNFCLLEGNGAAHVMVVCGNGEGLNLEDLAGARVPRRRYTAPLTVVLTLLSIGLLITIAREEVQTWFLMMIGGLGILQNIVVAGSPRPASALGFYLKKRRMICCKKVRNALVEADMEVPGAGSALRPLLFPGPATDSDDEAFEVVKVRHKQQNKQVRKHEQTGARGSEEEEAISSGRAGGVTESISVGSRRIRGGD
ncbi:MAG: hypothetical protein Q9209_000562 [Squamulea sp. 1 TL-2023]